VLVAPADVGGNNLENHSVLAFSLPQHEFGEINALDLYLSRPHVRNTSIACHRSSVQILDPFETRMGYGNGSVLIWRALVTYPRCYAGTMRVAMNPFRLLLISVAGWLNQKQQEALDYLQEENRVLREQLGGRRLRFSDDQRRRLAVRDEKLGWRMLHDLRTIVTPATLLVGITG
jgi:hypothetical protein